MWFGKFKTTAEGVYCPGTQELEPMDWWGSNAFSTGYNMITRIWTMNDLFCICCNTQYSVNNQLKCNLFPFQHLSKFPSVCCSCVILLLMSTDGGSYSWTAGVTVIERVSLAHIVNWCVNVFNVLLKTWTRHQHMFKPLWQQMTEKSTAGEIQNTCAWKWANDNS